jgi:hypothetical protein
MPEEDKVDLYQEGASIAFEVPYAQVTKIHGDPWRDLWHQECRFRSFPFVKATETLAARLAERELNQLICVNVADFADPGDPQGRTYREVNAEKRHGIPLGALVEIESGVRLFVVHQGRDCDQTPMYWLAATPDETERSRWTGAYPECDLVQLAPSSSIGQNEEPCLR